MNENIEKFLRQLLIDAGQTGMTEEVMKEMIVDLNRRLEDRLILTAIDSLPPDKQEELEQMAESGAGAGDMESFVKSNIPNWEEVFSKALLEFRESYLGKGQ